MLKKSTMLYLCEVVGYKNTI